MRRIGVFVCHCGTNIAATVDVKTVAETLAKSRQLFFDRLPLYVLRGRPKHN